MRKNVMVLALALMVGTGGGSAVSAETPEAEEVIESKAYTPRMTFTNASGGEVVFYGQFNPAFQSFDDGVGTTSGLVDNGNWNSRLGFRFETGLGLRSSARISQEARRPDWINWQRTSLRWVEVAWDTRHGSLSAGQGSTASDGTASLDDSFTFHAGAAVSSDGFSSFRFRDSTGALTDIPSARSTTPSAATGGSASAATRPATRASSSPPPTAARC
ncbi:hypothetical protein [Rhodobaculum claviforme]|uniref:Uncharacterized protein n=1 Tax=Rhodobaculum claviforme TaxID=1549854 RepID=A0A934TKZ4_9RHOB|nr:hypothetical protein [Rhodobaculum claviforme]MBK5927533.1 hypothetical protein [Rhodobaculum claviforme]